MTTKARVLIYDIETSPNLGFIWGKYEQNVISYKEEWFMLSFAYKWLGDNKTYVLGLDDFVGYEDDRHNDELLVRALWRLFDEADIVIAHNGDNFDQKKANARFLSHGMTPPLPYKSVDTLKVARRYFKFNSNKLGDLGEHLNLGSKGDTGGFNTWLGCMGGDAKAWAQMKKYNKQDVVLLEEVYITLRPWMENHPPMNQISGVMSSCPKCGGNTMHARGKYATKTQTYQRYHCQKCFGWSQSRVAEKAINKVEFV